MNDGIGKRKGWLNVELQSPDVIERRSKKIQPIVFALVCLFVFFVFFFFFFFFFGGGGGGGWVKQRLVHESKYFFAFARYDPSLFSIIRCL